MSVTYLYLVADSHQARANASRTEEQGPVIQGIKRDLGRDRDYRFAELKQRRNVLIWMFQECYNYRSHTEKRTRSGNKMSLYVNVVI